MRLYLWRETALSTHAAQVRPVVEDDRWDSIPRHSYRGARKPKGKKPSRHVPWRSEKEAFMR